MYGARSSFASRLALSLAAGSTVLSVLVASSGSILAGSRDARRLHHLLLFGGIAALSTAVTTYLASGAAGSGSALHEDSGDASADNDDSGSNASNKDSNEEADDEEAAALKAKRWIKKSEVWNEDEDDWVERKKKPDKPDEDADGKLFVVKHRVMPKQPLSDGFTIVEFKHSEHIVDTLRTIIKESEDLFESNAKVDVNALFLAKSGIEDALAKMVAERDRRQTEGLDLNKDDRAASSEEEANVEVSAPAAAVAADNDGLGKEPVGKPDDDAASAGSAQDQKAENAESNPSSEAEHTATDALDDDDEGTAKKQLDYPALIEKIDHVSVLLDFIREHFASTQAKLDRLLPKGNISFKLLWCVIKPGMIVKYTHTASGEAAAFQVRRCYTRSTMTGEQFYVTGTTLEWTGEKYVRMAASEAIPQFSGLRKLASLDCTPLSESDRAALIERGRIYASYAGPHFMQFTGALITPQPRPGTFMKSRADGRVMIDKSGFRRMNPSADVWEYPDGGDDDDYWSDDTHGYDSGSSKLAQTELTELSEDDHYVLTPPTVHGFSFVLKAWGEMLVDSFEAILFDKHAYDHLELDEDHKTLIRALVDASREDRKEKLISDVVQGKGGGIIAVLHGNPGVGKTLTAEAVAELLERPLYVQGAGDLGVDAATLESRLRDTLEIARVWKAVVLIDEADIFLEARSHHEISRNALVGVFLRTLEYQQGILFLTTNRVKSFDEAFLSRFSVAIRYPDLDQARRKKVWVKFLQLAGCDVEGATAPLGLSAPKDVKHSTNGTATPPKALISKRDLNRFAAEPLNGRVVKQTVRTAQALAISGEEPLNAGHVDQILRINKRFAEDFEAPAPDYQVASESWQSRSGLYR